MIEARAREREWARKEDEYQCREQELKDQLQAMTEEKHLLWMSRAIYLDYKIAIIECRKSNEKSLAKIRRSDFCKIR